MRVHMAYMCTCICNTTTLAFIHAIMDQAMTCTFTHLHIHLVLMKSLMRLHLLTHANITDECLDILSN